MGRVASPKCARASIRTRTARIVTAIGISTLLCGFGSTEISFKSANVPPSKLKIRLAKKNGLPVPRGVPGPVVKAILSKPDGDGPFPAVVMFPTSGGWKDTPQHWRERLNAWGYVTVEVFSYGSRDAAAAMIKPVNMVLDGVGALDHLRTLAYVDADRVAVMGWSLGAETALWAVDAAAWGGKYDARFAAAVALYPWCGVTGAFFAPVLVISAERDDGARPLFGTDLIERKPAGSAPMTMEVMPGAYHWFDLPHEPNYTFGVTYQHSAEATAAAVKIIRSFLEKRL